ncbi:MAG: 5-bromo-4-chloroindolyl phosphate hydrolysis family protein [Erysipelotrichaceae bacterium]|nr:5-bromo-4-chloroindolyl phosphate hydrolysis family protein [Erysipelotrichaceae bacterium]
MRRRPYGGGFIFFWFFLIMMMSDVFYGLAYMLFPLLFFGVIGYSIYSIIKKANSATSNPVRVEPTARRTINANRVSTSRTVNSRVSKISNADLNKIDKKLASYFKNNLTLPVIEGISLTTQSGKFTTVDQLYITYKDEKILKLEEFKIKYYPVYEKIMQLLLVFSKKGEDVMKADVETKVKNKKNILSDADKYIDRIDALNKAIPQEEITNGLYQTCDLLKQIDLLKETKNDENKVQKLYDYYLPILIDVLERYKKLQDAPTHGEDFKKCEAQLIKTIVLINEALKTIGNSMQEDDYMNINADISTLQSLLQKDGYGENPFGDKK